MLEVRREGTRWKALEGHGEGERLPLAKLASRERLLSFDFEL